MASERPDKWPAGFDMFSALPVAVGLGVSLAAPAAAQSVIGNANATVYLNSIAYPGGNPFTITAGTTIAAAADGVYGSLSRGWTLSNAGSITAGNNGVNLLGGGSLANQAGGAIHGAHMGVYTGATAIVSNNGLITATNGTGVSLYAGGTFTNNAGGTVTGGYAGVYAGGASGTLANAGTISGARYGVDMAGPGSLTNSGTIAGAEYGVRIAGPGSLTNSGRITQTEPGQSYAAVALNHGGYLLNNPGAVISGNPAGVLGRNAPLDVVNAGTIAGTLTGLSLGAGGRLDNAGLITGTSTAFYAGAGATLINTGTIAAGPGGTAIQFGPGSNSLTLGTGAVVDGAIDGGGSDTTIDLTGSGSLAGPLLHFGPAASLTISPGADWSAAGNWQIPTLFNQGTLQVGAVLRLTGNFMQAPLGTLVVSLTPKASTPFLISGQAELAGKLTVSFAPGHYAPATYQFLTAAGGISGRFAHVAFAGAPAALLATGAGPTALTLSWPSTSITNHPATLGKTVPFASLVLAAPLLVAPADDGIFASQAQFAAQDTQRNNATLLGVAEQLPPPASCAALPATPLSQLGQGFCRAGGWVITEGAATSAPGLAAAGSFFLAGVDRVVNQAGTRIGLATGYQAAWLHDASGGKASETTNYFGLYAAQPIGAFTLATDFLYGRQQAGINRATGAGSARTQQGTDRFAAAAALQLHLRLGPVAITPQAGIKAARLAAAAVAETGSALYALHAGGNLYTSLRPFFGAGISQDVTTGTKFTLTPSFTALYSYEAADTAGHAEVTTADGTSFATTSSPASRSQMQLAAALTAHCGRWQFALRYNANLAGRWTVQSGGIIFWLNF